MALKSYPETPAEEAARINAASGNPDGITAEQVASNRALNENLTNILGFGGGAAAAPTNPQAKLVSGVASSYQAEFAAVEASLPKSTSDFSKLNLENKISQASGELNSGLNSLTAGNLELPTGLSNAAGIGAAGQQAFGLVGSASQLATGIKNTAGDISGGLQKLSGGSLAAGIASLAGSISKAAGQLNDFLSLKRGANLPGGAELFTQSGQKIPVNPQVGDDWRVRINCDWSRFSANPMFDLINSAGTNGVVFPYTPNINFHSRAEYQELDITHTNYQYLAYKNSKIDSIAIEAAFSCETETDAAYWLAATTFFKTATKMFYGEGENAGNPPIICRLTGYGASIFNNVPVVITSFNLTLPPDVNYVKCDTFLTETFVPIYSTVNLEMKPIYNRADLRKFNLQNYAYGAMADSAGQGYL